MSVLRLEECFLWKLKFGEGKKNKKAGKEEKGTLLITDFVIRKTKKLRTAKSLKGHQAQPPAATM